ncbi:hypothetical protein Neosp_009615 [[Neocosmospora] mangrovei]
MDKWGYVPLSPETDATWKKCQAKAMRALEHPESDTGDLRDYYELTSKLAITKTAAKEALEAHETQVASLERQLQESQRQSNRAQFEMRIGDWASGIQNILKDAETQLGKDAIAQLRVDLRAKGYSTADIDKEVKNTQPFNAVKGLQVTEILRHVRPELDSIKRWKRRGAKAGDEPSTPYLDRIDTLCGRAGVSRSLYMSLLQVYNERNNRAHHPPPLEKRIRPDGTVEWNSVRKVCKEHRRRAKRDLKRGKINEAECNLFTDTINAWLRCHVTANAKNELTPTTLGKGAVQKVLTGRKTRLNKSKAVVPDSPWTEGKWDDII